MILDFRKMERPHRSGMLAVVLSWFLCGAWNAHVSAAWLKSGLGVEAGLTRTVMCYAIPLVCFNFMPPPPPPPPEEARQYETTPLVYCPRCPVRKHDKDFLCLVVYHPEFNDSDMWCDVPVQHYNRLIGPWLEMPGRDPGTLVYVSLLYHQTVVRVIHAGDFWWLGAGPTFPCRPNYLNAYYSEKPFIIEHLRIYEKIATNRR